MEKDYAPKHKPVEKKAQMKAQTTTSTQKKQALASAKSASLSETKPSTTLSDTTATSEPQGTTTAPPTHTTEQKTSPVPETKKPSTAPKTKKEVVTARGLSLAASKKVCMYIARYVRGKTIDQAIADLEDVRKYKKVVPYKGEIPHRSTPGIMSGRYPIKVAGTIIQVLKGLRGNALVNGMDLHKTRITGGSASWASRPGKRGGARFKRAHVTFTAQEKA